MDSLLESYQDNSQNRKKSKAKIKLAQETKLFYHDKYKVRMSFWQISRFSIELPKPRQTSLHYS